MKRITLMVGACLLAFSAQAQTEVIFEQAVGASGSGIVSDYYTVGTPTGVYSGDDFELTASADIYSVTAHGFQSNGDLMTFLSGFSLYIYPDAAGVPLGDPDTPGTGLLEIINLSPTDPALTFTAGTFTLDIAAVEGAPLNLAAGTYWLVIVPHIDLDIADPTLDGSSRWNWFASSDISGSLAKLIDPSNAFGAGATAWTTINDLTGPGFEALAFTLTGDNLAISNPELAQISLYPNPVQGQLNINLPSSVELQSATMFDILGQQTTMNISENNTLNTASLASGVYILKLETSQGTLTKKVIKK